MDIYTLTCRSLTYAQRVSRVLTAAGIRNMIVRTPQRMSREGCGYAARISGTDLGSALGALASAGVPPKKVFRQLPNGGYEEVPF